MRRTSSIAFGAGPLRVTVEGVDGAAPAAIADFFRAFGPPPGRPERTVTYERRGRTLRRGRRIVGGPGDDLDLARALTRDLAEGLPVWTRRRLGLHAAAVSHRGDVLLLPAPSRGGKSTLALGLVLSGCSYITDDLALLPLRAPGVDPFPRPVDLRFGAIDLFGPLGRDFRVHRTGRLNGTDRCAVRVSRRRTARRRGTVRLIVFPRVRLGGPTTLRPLSRSEAALRIARMACNLHLLRDEGFDRVVRVVAGADCYVLRVGRLRDGLRVLSHTVRARR